MHIIFSLYYLNVHHRVGLQQRIDNIRLLKELATNFIFSLLCCATIKTQRCFSSKKKLCLCSELNAEQKKKKKKERERGKEKIIGETCKIGVKQRGGGEKPFRTYLSQVWGFTLN